MGTRVGHKKSEAFWFAAFAAKAVGLFEIPRRRRFLLAAARSITTLMKSSLGWLRQSVLSKQARERKEKPRDVRGAECLQMGDAAQAASLFGVRRAISVSISVLIASSLPLQIS